MINTVNDPLRQVSACLQTARLLLAESIGAARGERRKRLKAIEAAVADVEQLIARGGLSHEELAEWRKELAADEAAAAAKYNVARQGAK
jgi:hypothetical protein